MTDSGPDNPDFMQLVRDSTGQTEPYLRTNTTSIHMMQLENENHSVPHNVNDVLELLGLGPYQCYLFIACGMYISFEYVELMLLTFLLPEIKNDWNLTETETGLIGTMGFFGMLLGSYVFGLLADHRGRRFVILTANFINIIASGLSAVCNTPLTLGTCRFFVGFASAGLFIAAVTMLCEFCSIKLRTKAMLLLPNFYTLGAIFSVLIAWFTIGFYINLIFYTMISFFFLEICHRTHIICHMFIITL